MFFNLLRESRWASFETASAMMVHMNRRHRLHQNKNENE